MGRHPRRAAKGIRGAIALKAARDRERDDVEAEVEAILASVEDLRDLLERTRARLDKLEDEREVTRQEQWRLKKEVATLTRIGEEYDDLAADNDRLRSHREQLRAGLKRIVGHTRALLSEHKL